MTAEALDQFVWLERVSIIEATTLCLLLGVAVPLKHVAHQPMAVAVMGPIHGLAFLAYLWVVLQAAAGGGWRRSEIARLVAVAFIPFGGFANRAFVRRKAASAQRVALQGGHAVPLD